MDFNKERENYRAKQKEKLKIKSMGDRTRSSELTKGWDITKKINCSPYIDKNVRPLLRGDVTGVLAPAD